LQKCISEAENELQGLLPQLEAKKQDDEVVRKECNAQEELVRSVQRKLSAIKTNLLTLSKTTHKNPDVASFVSETLFPTFFLILNHLVRFVFCIMIVIV